jgi:predicted  nucleic acid-binding Zn-ribbon protein
LILFDGIQDQIQDLETAKDNYEQQIQAIQAALDAIPQQIADLEALRDRTQSLNSNQIDLNINLNVTANGASIRSHSTPVGL